MKFNYQLSSVLGSVYKGGQVLFTQDGRYLLSPVGNRISLFDLLEHKVHTIDAVCHRDIQTMCLSPNGHLLLAIDIEGGGCFVNLLKRVILCQIHFKKPVSTAAFSPDSKIVAVGYGRHVQLWRCPALLTQFRPLTLLRTLTGHYEEVTAMDWSQDGKYLLTGSEDMSVRLHRISGEDGRMVKDEENAAASQSKVTQAGESGAPEQKHEDAMEDVPAQPAAASSSSASSIVQAAAPGLPPITLIGHRGPIVACYFGQPGAHYSGSPLVYSISKDGACFIWDWVGEEEALKGKESRQKERDAFNKKHGIEPEEKRVAEKTHSAKPKRSYSTALFGGRGKFTLLKKNYFNQNHAKVICASMHHASQVDLLVAGFDNGVFGLYELPDFNPIHTLSISQKRISSVSINSAGTWLAFGCEKLGSLLVWEWQSESYILKQQGHYYDINALDFSRDGQVLATGGDDGKVKLWNTVTGFSFVTFTNHTAPVTAVHWSGAGNVLLTASLDGTVRAFDLVRYRNFRTLTTPSPAQLTSLAVDPAGEIICAGALEPFEIYVWSLQTGKLLDILSGHTGPLGALSFGTQSSLLASCSWDKTVKIWDVFTGKGLIETFTHTTDVLTVVIRQDGKELVSSTLDGNLSFWDIPNGKLKGIIEGKKDIQGGRRVDDARSAENTTYNTAFTSICYSSDGKCILAGGNSKYVCIYDIASKLLLRKFTISSNLSLDGLLDKLNSKRMTEAGVSMDLINDQVLDDRDDDPESRIDSSLPGAKKGDFSSRRTRLAVRSKAVKFSPTGLQWACSTTDGLLIYSLDQSTIFDPQELTIDVTPANVKLALGQDDFSLALKMALALNQEEWIRTVLESIPISSINLVVRSLPQHRLERFLTFLSQLLQQSSHLEYMLQWTREVMTVHATTLQKNSQQLLTCFRHLAKTITQQHKDVATLCNDNTFTLDYLSQLGSVPSGSSSKMELVEDDEESNGIQNDDDDATPMEVDIPIAQQAKQNGTGKKQTHTPAQLVDDSEEESDNDEEESTPAPRVIVKKEKQSPRLIPSKQPSPRMAPANHSRHSTATSPKLAPTNLKQSPKLAPAKQPPQQQQSHQQQHKK